MAKKQLVNMDSFFSGAEQIHQLSQAEEEIRRLRTEIEELRAAGSVPETQLSNLRAHLKSHSGIVSIPLNQIQPNPAQPRQTFLPESIEAIAHSLERVGQLQPIILIESVQVSEKYFIFDGERRWRGANFLEWKALEAVIIPQPTALHRQTLLTSLHREDLSPLDKSEAIVKEIAQTTQLDACEVPRLLGAAIRRLTKQGKLTQLSQAVTKTDTAQQEILTAIKLSEQEEKIISVLLALQLNPASIDANIFPMLSLPTDLKVAMRDQGLKGAQALLLQQLSAKNLLVSSAQAKEIRTKTTTSVIEQQLSVAKTRQLVKQIKQTYNTSLTQKENNRSLSIITKEMKKLSGESLAQLETNHLKNLEQLMKEKLTEITNVLQQRS